MHTVRVLSEKNSSPEISLSVAWFVYPLPFFFPSSVGETTTMCLARNASKSGRHDATQRAIFFSSVLPFMQDLTLTITQNAFTD